MRKALSIDLQLGDGALGEAAPLGHSPSEGSSAAEQAYRGGGGAWDRQEWAFGLLTDSRNFQVWLVQQRGMSQVPCRKALMALISVLLLPCQASE